MSNSNATKIFLTLSVIALSSLTLFNILPFAEASSVNTSPVSEGNFKQWNLPTGVTYTKIQAVATDDGNTQYLTEHEEHDAQTFIFIKNLVPTGATINNVTIHVKAEKISATSTVNFKIRAAKGTTTNDGPIISATTSYVDYKRVMATNPFTGLAWTTSDIRNWTTGGGQLSFGMITSNDVDRNIRVTKVSLEINYVLDATPPVIIPTITGTLGNNGWYTTDVQVSWTVSDPESAITSPPCTTTNITTDTTGTTVTCSATSAGGTSTQSVIIKRDATPPIITVNGADPVVQMVGSLYTDAGASAADNIDGTDPVVTNGVVDTSNANIYKLNYTATDNAGNVAISKTRTVDIVGLAFANTFNGRFSSSSTPIVIVTDYLKSGSVPVLVQSIDTGTNTVRDNMTIILDEDYVGVFDNNLDPINLVASVGDKLNSNDLVFQGGDQIKTTYLDTFTIIAGSTADGVVLGAFPGTTPANIPGVRFYESDTYLISQYATLKVNDATVPLSTSSITAHVKSTTDPTGYDIILVRDSSTASSFTATSGIGFSLTSTNPATNQIKTKVGDNVSATYGSSVANAIIISDPTVAVTSVPSYQINSTVADTCAMSGGDTDQDGICDNWENQSTHPGKIIVPTAVTGKGADYVLTCNSAATLTTDPTGATVCPSSTKRDVYVELDQMQGHKMSLQAIADVVKAFNNGNTATITGVSSGVTLHVFVDDTVPHFASIPWNSTDPTAVTVESLKQKYFGFASERTGVKPLPAGITSNATYIQDQLNKKRQFFHWTLMMHDQTETPTSSGRGEKPGNDFVISLGEFAGKVGTVDQQEATFMHELGHNLGLDHGGLDSVNGKPNEPSVMNYLFQFNKTQSGGALDRPLDYSRYAYNSINENSVNESKILGSGTLGTKSINTLIGGFDKLGVAIPAPYISTTLGKATVSVDLNQDGQVSKTLYTQNVHYFVGIPGLDDTTKRLLNSTNDWANLNFKFRQQSTFRDGVVTIHNTDAATSSDGLIPAADSVAPDVSITNPAPIYEGGLYQPDITITDFDSKYWDIVVDYGDGKPTQSAHLTSTNSSVSAIDHTYSDSGDYTIKVTVTSDRSALAGVSTTVSTTIHVNSVYIFGGFRSPIPNSEYNTGRTLPVKFTVTDGTGVPVSTAVAKIYTFVGTCTDSGTTACNLSNSTPGTSSSQSGNTAVYSSGVYQYNLKTNNFKEGKTTIIVSLDDGTIHTVTIKFDK